MSSEYRIFETRRFSADLREIERSGQPKVVAKLRETVDPQLRRHPHFGPHVRKLKDHRPEAWRYRIGAWRFFYEIDDDERIVFMTAAHHRSSAY